MAKQTYRHELHKPYYLNLYEDNFKYHVMPLPYTGSSSHREAIFLRKKFGLRMNLIKGKVKTIKIVEGIYY